MISAQPVLHEVTNPEQNARLDPVVAGYAETSTSSNDIQVIDWQAFYRGRMAGSIQLVHYLSNENLAKGYWLCGLYVPLLQRGRGIGIALSRAVIERARMEGASDLNLLVHEDNSAAINLYRKLNFELFPDSPLGPLLAEEYRTYGRRSVVMRRKMQQEPDL